MRKLPLSRPESKSSWEILGYPLDSASMSYVMSLDIRVSDERDARWGPESKFNWETIELLGYP